MKAKELMMGDVVLCQDGKELIAVLVVHFDRDAVRVRRKDGHMFNIAIELLQPELIGPGLLELFGFETTPDGLLFKLDGTDHVLARFDKESNKLEYVEISVADKIDVRATNIQYVHQLQHLIRLCNIDKLIM